MAKITATLRNYRQAPRKVRLLSGLVRGKSVDHALASLRFTQKRAAEPIEKLIKSAVANAKERFDIGTANLRITSISVDKGSALRRFRPGARGTAYPYKKFSSHLKVTLDDSVQIPAKLKNKN